MNIYIEFLKGHIEFLKGHIEYLTDKLEEWEKIDKDDKEGNRFNRGYKQCFIDQIEEIKGLIADNT
ncbi:MAG: hypothetical protein KAJ75_06945 [Alphaproteobacteria bacterium]|nr:hypothetical protein [Alphaproteobacteria bacterium]